MNDDRVPPPLRSLGIVAGFVLTIAGTPPLLRLHVAVAVAVYVAMVPLLLVVRHPFVRGLAVGVLVAGGVAALIVGTCAVMLRDIG